MNKLILIFFICHQFETASTFSGSGESGEGSGSLHPKHYSTSQDQTTTTLLPTSSTDVLVTSKKSPSGEYFHFYQPHHLVTLKVSVNSDVLKLESVFRKYLEKKLDEIFTSYKDDYKVKICEVEKFDGNLIELRFILMQKLKIIDSLKVVEMLRKKTLKKLSADLKIKILEIKSFDKKEKNFLIELLICIGIFVAVFGALTSFIIWTLLSKRRKHNIVPIKSNVELSERSALQQATSLDSLRVFSSKDQTQEAFPMTVEDWLNGDTGVSKKEVKTAERSVQTKKMKQESLYLDPDNWLKPEIYEFQLQQIEEQIASLSTNHHQSPNESIFNHTYQSLPISPPDEQQTEDKATITMKTITEEKGVTTEYTEIETKEKSTITNVVAAENKATITRKKTSKNKETSTKENKLVEKGDQVKEEDYLEDLRVLNEKRKKEKVKRKENLFPEIVDKKGKMRRRREKMNQARAELDAILGGSETPVVSSEYEDYQMRNRLKWQIKD